METIETPRLIIRDVVESDAWRLREYRDKPEVAEYQSWRRYSLKTAQKRISQCLNKPFTGKFGQNTQLAITLKDGTMIGDLYLEAVSHQTIGIGYTLDSDYWNHGYAREAVRAILVHMRDVWGYKKAMAYIYIDHERSRSLLVDLGFHQFSESKFYKDQGYILVLEHLQL